MDIKLTHLTSLFNNLLHKLDLSASNTTELHQDIQLPFESTEELEQLEELLQRPEIEQNLVSSNDISRQLNQHFFVLHNSDFNEHFNSNSRSDILPLLVVKALRKPSKTS